MIFPASLSQYQNKKQTANAKTEVMPLKLEKPSVLVKPIQTVKLCQKVISHEAKADL